MPRTHSIEYHKVAPNILDQVEPCLYVNDPSTIKTDYQRYLHDESRIIGDCPGSLAQPQSTLELKKTLRESLNKNIFLGGGRTGVVGGAVPFSSDSQNSGSARESLLVSTEKLSEISPLEFDENGIPFVWVGAGVTLYALEEYLRESAAEYHFPVDPTETWASFGGLAATCAAGARSFHYGSVRDWIQAIECVTVTGDVFLVERNVDTLNELTFFLAEKELQFPEIPKPTTKNSIGYHFKPNMDLIDLFIGSEGTLVLFSKLKIRLDKRPSAILSLLQFFKTPAQALSFVRAIREKKLPWTLSLEFLDDHAIAFGMNGKARFSSQIQKILVEINGAAIYAEFSYDENVEEDIANLLDAIETSLSEVGASLQHGVCGTSENEVLEMKRFRHAVPETINSLIAERKKSVPSLRKVATDMAVPEQHLEDVYQLYRNHLDDSGISYAIFGHAGDNHFHVNILPESEEDLSRALSLYRKMAEAVVRSFSGAIAAEHGIGRIKKDFLKIQYTEEILNIMRNIKSAFDPDFRLSPGVLIDR